jgi:hypothetical protein
VTGAVPAEPAATPLTPLEQRALAWIEPYWNAEHLRRTRDWLLVLDPDASEALRLAAVTHDMERHVPGGPVFDPGTMAPEEPSYRAAHSERSAAIVGDWLAEQGAAAELVAEVRRLIVAHEIGGSDEEDLLQAADSLSFLETNAELVARWYTSGRCSRERARAQNDRMYERIRIERARELARPLWERANAVVDAA